MSDDPFGMSDNEGGADAKPDKSKKKAKAKAKSKASSDEDKPRKQKPKRAVSLTAHRESLGETNGTGEAEAEVEAEPKEAKGARRRGADKHPPNYVEESKLKEGGIVYLALKKPYKIIRMPPATKEFMCLHQPRLPDESTKTQQEKVWEEFIELLRKGKIPGDGLPYMYILQKLGPDGRAAGNGVDDMRTAFYFNNVLLIPPSKFVTERWSAISPIIYRRLTMLDTAAQEVKAGLLEMKKQHKRGEKLDDDTLESFKSAAKVFLSTVSSKTKPTKMGSYIVAAQWPPELLTDLQKKWRKVIEKTTTVLSQLEQGNGFVAPPSSNKKNTGDATEDKAGAGSDGEGTDGAAASTTKKVPYATRRLDDVCNSGKTLAPCQSQKAATEMKKAMEQRMRTWVQNKAEEMVEKKAIQLTDTQAQKNQEANGMFYTAVCSGFITAPVERGGLGIAETDLTKLPAAMPPFGTVLDACGIDHDGYFMLHALTNGAHTEHALRYAHLKHAPPPVAQNGDADGDKPKKTPKSPKQKKNGTKRPAESEADKDEDEDEDESGAQKQPPPKKSPKRQKKASPATPDKPAADDLDMAAVVREAEAAMLIDDAPAPAPQPSPRRAAAAAAAAMPPPQPSPRRAKKATKEDDDGDPVFKEYRDRALARDGHVDPSPAEQKRQQEETQASEQLWQDSLKPRASPKTPPKNKSQKKRVSVTPPPSPAAPLVSSPPPITEQELINDLIGL
jgi:hypothetical protein